MIIKINDDRGFETQTLYFGYLEENNSTTIEFEFPEYLEKYNKKLNFMLADGTTVCKLFDDINSNKFTFTRDLLKFNKLQMAIEFFDTEENLIYRTSILTIRISDSIVCDDDISADDPKILILDELIQKVNELNTEITENEATRESNEQTRISNEETRVANETARQEYVTQLKKDVELGNLDGATFTPHVSESGDLSWSNNKNLTNPETVNIKGEKGDKGQKGDTGAPFRIVKTYPSVEVMQSDFENMPIDSYVMIATSIEIEDNAKLYYRAETEWVYITDFSGAIGIQGPKGDDGDTGAKGEQGEPGVGISKLEVIDGALYVTLTNNVRENAGLILTDEVKAWLVSQITGNAESDFNTYYNSKVEEFNTNATEKTTAYNTNAEDKLNEYNTNATNKINEYNTNAEAILKILPNKTTEISEEIDVDDAGESSFNKLSVFGNSRQESTTGKNLLYEIRSGYLTTVENQEATTTEGSQFGNWQINFKNKDGSTSISLEAGEYYVSLDLKINSGSVSNPLNLIAVSKKDGQETINNPVPTTKYQRYCFKSIFNSAKNVNNIIIQKHYDEEICSFKIKNVMISKMSDYIYEPYTGRNPSPNPDYPQEIEAIGNNINLFDKDNTDMFLDGMIPDNYGLIQAGTTSTDKINYIRTIIMECKPNTSYAISRYIEGKTFFVYESDVYPVEGSQTTLLKRNDSTGKISEIITTSESTNYLLVKIYNTYVQEPIENKDFFENIKIEEGKVATSYSPYGMGSTTFKRTGKNYNKYPYFDGDLSSTNGLTYTVQEDLGIKIEGTSTGETYYDIHKGYNFKKGTYKVSVVGLTDNIRLNIVPYLKDGSHLDALVFDKNNTVKDLILEEDVTLNDYIAIVNTDVTVNTVLYLQIEKGTEATEYEPYHEDVYTLPVQQEMLEEDTFEKENGTWYEKHTWNIYECIGTENWLREEINSSGKYRYGFYNYPFGTDRNRYNESMCTHLKDFNQYGVEDLTFGVEPASIRLNFNPQKTFETVEEFKDWLVEQKNAEIPVKIAYKLETPTKLPCTPEQTAVLNQLEQFSLDKGINHIFSDDELSPKFQLKYYQDMNILLDKINKSIADV